ncbi:MAG: 30S ribosomal protein S13 [Candidatus Melainabacteria bacterium]|nr:30S ribosomal protein S13 [Candidatus Melainabacteria bacterium]
MARFAGVDLPQNKRTEISLTYLYGIGRSLSNRILEKTGIDKNKRMKDLTDAEINKLREEIEKNHQVEGDLRRIEGLNVKRLTEINCYKGMRHRKGLPVRGQRTKTNARTRRGRKRMTVAGKKQAPNAK